MENIVFKDETNYHNNFMLEVFANDSNRMFINIFDPTDEKVLSFLTLSKSDAIKLRDHLNSEIGYLD